VPEALLYADQPTAAAVSATACAADVYHHSSSGIQLLLCVAQDVQVTLAAHCAKQLLLL
jgi:hypothetical protein